MEVWASTLQVMNGDGRTKRCLKSVEDNRGGKG